MSSIRPHPTVDAVNVAILQALGYDPAKDLIETLTLKLSAREYPTVTVTRYISEEASERITTEVRKLRLREVTGDGM